MTGELHPLRCNTPVDRKMLYDWITTFSTDDVTELKEAILWRLNEGLFNGIPRTIYEGSGSIKENSAENVLEELRSDGWMVAIHNDYWHDGKPHTFWLMTNRDGRYFKGESSMDHGGDVSALNQIKNAIAKLRERK